MPATVWCLTPDRLVFVGRTVGGRKREHGLFQRNQHGGQLKLQSILHFSLLFFFMVIYYLTYLADPLTLRLLKAPLGQAFPLDIPASRRGPTGTGARRASRRPGKGPGTRWMKRSLRGRGTMGEVNEMQVQRPLSFFAGSLHSWANIIRSTGNADGLGQKRCCCRLHR